MNDNDLHRSHSGRLCLKKLSEFAADISADSKGTEAAKALFDLLHSPEGVAAFLTRGFDPN